MRKVLQRAISTVLIVAVTGMSLLVGGGCEKDEIHTTSSLTVEEKVVDQHEVVE